MTARNTVGLNLVLHDNQFQTIGSLSPDDVRTTELRIAGPASLVVSKATKLIERIAGPTDRVATKDASDVLRLLRNADSKKIGRRLKDLAKINDIADEIGQVVDWLSEQSTERASPSLVSLAIQDLESLESANQVDVTFRHLLNLLVREFNS